MKKSIAWFLLRIVKFFIYLFTLLPRKLQFFFGDVLGLLWFDVFRIRRDVVLDNLEIAFPDWSEAKRRSIGRKSCQTLGRNFTEFARMPFLKAADKKDFVLKGIEHLHKAMEQGRGVCLLTLHLGNGDMATAGLALHGYPITVISKEFKVGWINDLWFGVRRRVGANFIPPRNSSYHILKSLKKNALVAFVLDQFMGPPIGVRTNFFGRETGTALGLAVIANRSKSPVVPVYSYRNDSGQTVTCFEPEIPFEESEDRDQGPARMTQIYTDKLEEFVRRHPEQWMWVHRRWKEFRD